MKFKIYTYVYIYIHIFIYIYIYIYIYSHYINKQYAIRETISSEYEYVEALAIYTQSIP